MKVMTIVGTRPELIRLSRVIAKLDETVDHVLVHTGQNYDYTLNEIFFEELGIRRPDHLLGVDTSSLGTVLGETLIKTEEVLNLEKPDAVLVLGDTNSCIAALMAKRMRIPVYHMEAGNRCFDDRVPEETNRRMVDHVADFNLVYTEHARRNLLAEGLPANRIVLTGSPLREVLTYYRPAIDASPILDELGLAPGGYFLASVHRQENVDVPRRLAAVMDSLAAVSDRWQLPVLVSTHPRTRARMEALDNWIPGQSLRFHKPFGFFAYNQLQRNARCVLSDSGSISEESSILRFPAITLRSAIERPEFIDAGGIVTTDVYEPEVTVGIQATLRSADLGDGPPDVGAYRIENTSERVSRFILSSTRRHKEWLARED
ncbi:non-hydrolyzing UDP-N-acetylglucosamine 2-epimerase [Nakamurella sp.]|uniref:non-hydrolyzing UDP-N-acetylglucosamine 2-epimerase n=1 Tax=Nakamurella sp. TaxID=1869182 RepID=UPI00378302DC